MRNQSFSKPALAGAGFTAGGAGLAVIADCAGESVGTAVMAAAAKAVQNGDRGEPRRLAV